MAVGLSDGLQALLPRLILYTIVGTCIAWFYHLMQPALEAALSNDYRSFTWVSEKRGVGSFLKSTWDVAFKSRELFAEIHRKILGTNDENIHLVPIPHCSTGFMLMVPKQLLNEYVRQPENDISLKRYTLQALVPDYTTLGAHIVIHPVYRSVVHKELYQKLADKMDMVNEEMTAALDEAVASKVGENGEAKINMWDTANRILSRSANRIISGYPLCHNQEYQDATAQYAATFFASALYARFIPPFLRPFLLPLMCRPLMRCIKTAAKHATPVIMERMAIIDTAQEKGIEAELPNDMLSAIIMAAKKDSNSAAEYDPMVIVARMMVLNFVQSYTNLVTMTNLVYDLISLPEGDFEDMVSDLRAEIKREMAKGDGFSHNFFQRLDLMDSLIRESMRYNPIGETGIERAVGKRGGFTFSNGIHVPQGALLAAPIKAYQRDEMTYPGGFNPRRSTQDPEHPKMTDISPNFLNFGLGRGACPGRFFTSNLLKLTLTHLLLDYDFERLETRPENVRKVTLDEPCGRFLITLKKREVQ
ncbi:cytochrome P450 [Mariannaea sp. PMI_226]|nr:cytochrome P450 [Mariannaea sp. PMI_226]